MTGTKITDLTAVTGANLADGDEFVVVDVSDTTMAASGTDKKITKAELSSVMGAVTSVNAMTGDVSLNTLKPATVSGSIGTTQLVSGGDSDSGNFYGGNLILTAGASAGLYRGGNVFLYGGYAGSGAQTGAVTISTRAATGTDTAGSVLITAGSAENGSAGGFTATAGGTTGSGFAGNVTFSAGIAAEGGTNGYVEFNVDASPALKLGPAANTIGFNGATPVGQHAAIADASGGAVQDAEARSALNTLLAYLRSRGDIAT